MKSICYHGGMHLKALQLESFRNYESLSLDLSNTKTLALVGQNAQGKTNLLESIAFLALGKSFRAQRSLDTLGWERPHGRIKGVVENKGKETPLEIFFQRSPDTKKVKRHNKVVPPKEFIGQLRVVLFTPEHLHLVSGSPSLRRQYMDRVLVQIDALYLDALGQYRNILKQRNALLKRLQTGQAQKWELELWDAKLVSEAQIIWQKRREFLSFLQEKIAPLYSELAGKQQNLVLKSNTHEDRFEERLIANQDQDIRFGSTSVGPHRDDFTLHLENKVLSEFGSRGECRSAILSLKMAEIEFIEARCKAKPLLLLDDVFSELDEARQKHLGKLLKECQSIITTTALEHLKGLQNVQVYTVDGGKLTEA